MQENSRQRARHPLAHGEQHEHTAQEPDEPEGGDSCLAAFAADAIARLPSPYREALTITELQGLSQAAAAEMLGISVSGMKSRVQRGRDRLRAIIDECCKVALDARGGVMECEPRRPGECRCSRERS